MTAVLMTVDGLGGVWTYALELADALAQHNVRVTLAAMGPALTQRQRDAATSSAALALHESTYPLEWMDDPWAGVDAAGEWLLALAAELQPDVVHLNGYCLAALPWRAPTLVVAHSCVLAWWDAVHGVEAPPAWDEYRVRVRAGLAAAGAVCAPTQAALADLSRYYGIDWGTVVPNGRRADWVRSGPKEPLVLTAGRLWDEAKNVAAADRVAARLPWPVLVVGSTVHPSGSRVTPRYAVPLGHLPQEELAHWLRRAAIFVLPARYEPFGLGPIEAGLSRCALVLGDLPSLREVWDEAAIYVDPTDDDDLAAACRELIDDPNRCRELGERARERALTFTPERMAAGHLALYRRLLAEVDGPAGPGR
ncbi:MAG: glycosyl transferase family 1 [Acidimicrobiales bacterium]|nr:glycosyl transferase family 1 [Acidimicrobiales bacterium]